MENVIIGIALIGIIALAIRGSAKHFRGEGGCCGGSSSSRTPRKRLKGKIMKTYTLSIEGMRCQNCASTVERVINEFDGAASKVSLGRHEARVYCDREIDIELIIASIKSKGYSVIACKGD